MQKIIKKLFDKNSPPILIAEISALLEGGDEFELERRSATNIWHDYQDNKSSERSSEVIKKLLFSGEKN